MPEKLYAIACMATLDLPGVVKSRVAVDSVKAASSEEALGKALLLGHKLYPPSEGWLYYPVQKEVVL